MKNRVEQKPGSVSKETINGNSRLITVYSGKILPEVYAAQAALEREDILTFRKDEFTTQTAPYLTSGIQLQVMEDDLLQAIEILQREGYIETTVSRKIDYVKQSMLFIALSITVLLIYLWVKGIL